MVFPVIMFGYESWTVRKAERRRIDAFELWCWRRLLRVPWTARRYNQSILKETGPEYSLEGLMLEPKLQYFGHLMRRTNSFEKNHAGKDWGQEEKGTTEDEMVGWHQWRMDMNLSKLWELVIEKPGVLWSMGLQSRTRLSDWTELVQPQNWESWVTSLGLTCLL